MNTYTTKMIKRIIFGSSLQPKLGRWTTQQSMTEMKATTEAKNTAAAPALAMKDMKAINARHEGDEPDES